MLFEQQSFCSASKESDTNFKRVRYFIKLDKKVGVGFHCMLSDVEMVLFTKRLFIWIFMQKSMTNLEDANILWDNLFKP